MLKNKKIIYIAVTGFIVSISAFFFAKSLENKRLRTIFEKDASDRIGLIQNSIEMTELVIESLHNLFLASDHVSKTSFHDFVKSYSKRINGTKAIGWTPKVTHSNKKSFINEAKKLVSSEFEIITFDSTGNSNIAELKKEYFPIYYLDPLELNEDWIGFDLSSTKTNLEAINNSINYNKLTVTQKKQRKNGSKKDLGILLLQPIFKRINDGKSKRSNTEELTGFVFCSFEPQATIETSIGMLQKAGIDIYLKDESANKMNELLYYHNSQKSNSKTNYSEVNDIYLIKQFLFGGRVWSITCVPTTLFFKTNNSIVPEIIFFIFFSLSAFFIYYYYRNSNEKQKINRLVEMRTKELNDSTERLNLALNGADLGMWDWNITTGDVYFNERWSTMLGYSLGEIKSCLESWNNLLHPDDSEEVYKVLNQHLERKIPIYSTEHRLLTKSGKWKWILDVGKVVERDEKGNALRATGIHMDISERKTIQQKILVYNNKLEKTNQDKNKLFSIIGHDLKSPLASIKGFSDFLTNELDDLDKKEIKEYSKYIFDASNSLFHMLEGLLDWGRVQMGSIQFTPNTYNISKQIERVLSQYAVIIANKKIQIDSNFKNNIEVFADEIMIETILRNLISNALKFTPSNGKISINISENGESSVLISISDTGVGIEKSAFEKLFQDSFHLSTNGTDGEKGTGLGLSLCKDFVEMNNGKIWAESEENKGTTFYFTLNSKEQILLSAEDKIFFQNQ